MKKGGRTGINDNTPQDPSRPLRNPRREAFCIAYTGEHIGNATASYIAAGYKVSRPDCARSSVHNILADISVKERIAYLKNKYLASLEATAEEARARLGVIAKATYADFLDERGMVDIRKVRDPALAPAVEYCIPVTVKDGTIIGYRLKLYDATRAMELLGLAEAPAQGNMNQVLVIKA